MKIEEYFALYEKLKTNKANQPLKQFCFLDKRTSLIKYLKNKKSFIIKNINYSFFHSDEPYLLSVFADRDINFIHINIKKLPPNFDSLQEYENYLAIYGTFAVLINQSFQIEYLNDSRLNIYIKDFLEDLTFKIYYDESFRLNLQDHINKGNSVLKYVYAYGYDYLFVLFKAYFQEKLEFGFLIQALNIDENELTKLYKMYESKILIGESSGI